MSSNTTRAALLVVSALLTATAVGCGGQPSASTTVTVTSTAPATLSATANEPTASGQTWTMPNLIGKNLQDAQDAIQELTNGDVFYSGSTDLTGQGRNQIVDNNWQVCTSTPAPGEPFSKDTPIDFGVVRIDSEECP